MGIIGTGMVADLLLGGLKKIGAGSVLWMADTNKNLLRRKMKKYAVPCGTDDYRDILKDPRVEGVIIAAPPFTHYRMTVDALNAGKHVLLEKPMVARRTQISPLVSEVRKHRKLVVLECSARHTRLQPKFHYIKKMIDEGAVGSVYHIHHNQLMRRTFIEYNPDGKWSLNNFGISRDRSGAGQFFLVLLSGKY